MHKKLALICLICLPLLLLSCSSDDPDIIDPPPSITRLVSAAATSAVSAIDVDDPAWNSATAQTISLVRGSLTSPARLPEQSTAQRAATSLSIKALTYNDTLYLRLRWSDSTFSVWPDAFEVIDTFPTTWENKATVLFEDQLIVMFDTVGADTVDTWYWRAMSTAQRELAPELTFGFAEGTHKVGTNLISDSSTLNVVIDNPPRIGFSSQPKSVHLDSSSYNGYFLYDPVDTYDQFVFDTLWSVGQRVPGWLTDSTIEGTAKAAARASRWDIWALSEWMDVASEYTVVLRRPLNTGFTDDLNMLPLDSARIRIGLADDFKFDLSLGNQDQSFSSNFWIIF